MGEKKEEVNQKGIQEGRRTEEEKECGGGGEGEKGGERKGWERKRGGREERL